VSDIDRQNKKLTLKTLRRDYSPTVNPLVEPQAIQTKKRFVRSGKSEELVNVDTGEIRGVATIFTTEERDDTEFVKVFAAGVAATYELTKTAQRVFQLVLDQYQRTPMSRGYADYVNLFWFDGGVDGRAVDMSERTFMRGLKELLEKRFIASKDGNGFWVNPALFFKGDRVMFIREYRRRKQPAAMAIDRSVVPPVDTDRLAKLDDEIRAQTMIERARAELLAKRNAL
jgi:hypothetical protein